jgi:hypothetical protein
MKVLRAAVVLGLSTPLVVLACGSDDGVKSPRDGAAGEGGGADEGAAGEGSGATSSGGSSNGLAGAGAGGDIAGGGATAGGGGVGAAETGGAAGETSGGAGGAVNEIEPECGDDEVGGTLVCFDAPSPHTLVEGVPTDLAIGAWDAEDGLDVIVTSNLGLSYFSNEAGSFTGDTYVTTAGTGTILGIGQLDSGASLDILLGQAPSGSGNSIINFGNGTGVVANSVSSYLSSEGVLINYFVADVAGSGASQDLVVTFGNSISLALTTGTEGEGFLGPVKAVYPPAPQDAVVATLGSSQWLVYSTETNVTRQEMTYETGSVTLGDPLATPAGGAAAQLDVGDFNEDGFDDVVATLTASSNASVLFGSGVGTGDFAVVIETDRFLTLSVGTTEAAKTQRDVKVGDFNGDGHADLAVSVEGLDAVAIFSGDGSGAFSEPELVSTGEASGPTRLAVGDLNDDGVDDLAVVGGTSQEIILLLSNP